MICDKVAPLPMTDDFVAIETAILAHAFQSSSSFLINYGLYSGMFVIIMAARISYRFQTTIRPPFEKLTQSF
jgi:hypothetical protein